MTSDPNKQCEKLAMLYRSALFVDVIPFWERHSLDRECGGYFTGLNREGGVYDTDKFMWLQARQVWMFSHLCTAVEHRAEWLEIAKHGIDFLTKYGRDEAGHWHFSLNREGKPLTHPHSIFSDCFAAMAFGTYAQVAGDSSAQEVALQTYQNILKRKDDPKGRFSKIVPGTRPMKSLAIPMILTDVTRDLAPLLGEEVVDDVQRDCEAEVFGAFLNAKTGLLHEAVGEDNSHLDCFDGRLINPGHTLEAMRFIMQAAEARSDEALIAKSVDTILKTMDFGWDEEHGGIFYFMDSLGKPPDKLEWSQKLWWVHIEALVALLMAHRLTGREDLWQWFERVHDWTWERFPDPEHGEWYGYLSRGGDLNLSLKGGKWKGCFHVPRGLLLCAQELEALAR